MDELNKIKKGSAVGDTIELTYYRPSKDSIWTAEVILTEHAGDRQSIRDESISEP
jgi:hypothetical protein